MADKLMSFTVLLCIVLRGLVPWWAVAVYFVKEALLSIGALVQFKKIDDVPHSHPIGKFSTVFFFAACFVIMLFPEIPKLAASILIGVALSLTLAAFFFYLRKFIGLTKKNKS
jgi:cardiolipin synthase